ncbi:hypothetical protein DMC64_37175 [Amycolatopsis sp. WAC 04197]|nr:hypothetical protein DMC64_37175 [Amycolatopsis sp. WAC 04197]
MDGVAGEAAGIAGAELVAGRASAAGAVEAGVELPVDEGGAAPPEVAPPVDGEAGLVVGMAGVVGVLAALGLVSAAGVVSAAGAVLLAGTPVDGMAGELAGVPGAELVGRAPAAGAVEAGVELPVDEGGAAPPEVAPPVDGEAGVVAVVSGAGAVSGVGVVSVGVVVSGAGVVSGVGVVVSAAGELSAAGGVGSGRFAWPSTMWSGARSWTRVSYCRASELKSS